MKYSQNLIDKKNVGCSKVTDISKYNQFTSQNKKFVIIKLLVEVIMYNK